MFSNQNKPPKDFQEYLNQHQNELDSQSNENSDAYPNNYQEGDDNYDDQFPQSLCSIILLKNNDSEIDQSRDHAEDPSENKEIFGAIREFRTSLSQKISINYSQAQKEDKNCNYNSNTISKTNLDDILQQSTYKSYFDKTPVSETKPKPIHQNIWKLRANTLDFTNVNKIDKENMYEDPPQKNEENLKIFHELEQELNSHYSPPLKMGSPMKTDFFYSPITYNGSEKNDSKNNSPNSQGCSYNYSNNTKLIDSPAKQTSFILQLCKLEETNKSLMNPITPIYQVLLNFILLINRF